VGLARRLYGFQGDAFLCRIPGEDFGEGEGLSALAEANVRKAVRLLRAFPDGAGMISVPFYVDIR
jgi:hypothetical protein